MKRAFFVVVALAASAGTWGGCSQNATTVGVRSLERSGQSSFLCVRDPLAKLPGRQLDSCFTVAQPYAVDDYSVPHALSLVTQTARGEVAVVDITAASVVDVDLTVPGYNFLPVGNLPTDIVSTPGSTASFVAVGDPSRPGIFALPTARLLPSQNKGAAPTLSSWPACALPGIPREMILVGDRTASATDPGGHRARCDGPSNDTPAEGFDLSHETELFGTQKLVVTMPAIGEVAIIDAQALLMLPAGNFDACPFERRFRLHGDAPVVPPSTAADGGPSADAETDGAANDGDAADGAEAGDATAADTGIADGAATPGADAGVCVNRAVPSTPPSQEPRPAAMAYADDGRLFVSDERASLIHVVDLADVCAPIERLPLLPFSVVDPSRAVVTGAIAVSPVTSDDKRFVYAVDVKNSGSLMVFDVSRGSTVRTPILRPDASLSPGEPADRIALPAPAEGVTFAYHEVPVADPASNTVKRGERCDPADPNDPYRTADDFLTTGAGPAKLRGIFAFAVLATAQVAVVDIDDFDDACRRPRYTDDKLLGCAGGMVPEKSSLPSASQEVTCRVVERHRLRSSQFITNVDQAGRHAPSMLTYPLLFDKYGSVLPTDPSQPESVVRPKLLGPSFCAPASAEQKGSVCDADLYAQQLMSAVSGVTDPEFRANPRRDTSKSVELDTNVAQHNWVAFNLKSPRAHVDQAWTIRYEGVLPWFSGRRGRMQCAAKKSGIECSSGDDPSQFVLYDSSATFCDEGAQGGDLAAAAGLPSGDIMEILDDFPAAEDPYWTTVAGVCSRDTCETHYGALDAPRIEESDPSGSGRLVTGGRDFVVEKSFQDRLLLRPNPTDAIVPSACCFPYPVLYAVRGGKQWIVTGSTSGFGHRLTPNPAEPNSSIAACVESCDPVRQRRNGRVAGLPSSVAADPNAIPRLGAVLEGKDRRAFSNAQLSFVIWNPQERDRSSAGCAALPPDQPCIERDTFFQFQETGGYRPLLVTLSSATAGLVLPQSIQFVRGLEQLAVPDAASQGVILLDLTNLGSIKAYY